MNSQKQKENNKDDLILASPSLWSSNSNFFLRAENSSSNVSKRKKVSFTPQPTATSSLPKDLEIISFDDVVSNNTGIDEPITLIKSSTEPPNKNLLDCFKIFNQEYSNIVNSIHSFSKQNDIRTNKRAKTTDNKSDESSPRSIDNSSNSIISEEEEEERKNQKEEMKEMTNIQEITDFNQYTKNCMELIDEMNSKGALELSKYPITKEREVILPFVNEIAKGKKRLAIFDLDETLIHCELNPENKSQTTIDVVLPNKKTKQIGLNIRPHWKEELLKIKTKYYIIMYTASHQSYADSVVNYLDPHKEIFDLRLYRNNCTIVLFEGNTFYIKDLRIMKDVSLRDIVLIDNSVLSFAFHLDNGIPILPYYNGEEEIEMQNLCKLLLKLAECENIPAQIHNLIGLEEYTRKVQKKKSKSRTGTMPRQSSQMIKKTSKEDSNI